MDTIQSLTFNPFIEETDINSVVECTFNSDKYGIPDGGIPKCYRIESLDNIEKELGNIQLFENKSKYDDQLYPFDPKLELYPYTYYLVTDYVNPPLLVKPQYVNSNNNKIILKVTTTPLSAESKYYLYVEGY